MLNTREDKAVVSIASMRLSDERVDAVANTGGALKAATAQRAPRISDEKPRLSVGSDHISYGITQFSHASFVDPSTRSQRNHHPARLQQRVVQFDSLPLYGGTDTPQLAVLRTMASQLSLSVAGMGL